MPYYMLNGIDEKTNTRVSTQKKQLPEITRIPLSGLDMMKLNPDAKLIKYPDLYKYKTIDELFADCDKVIILVLTISNSSGHWTALFKNKQGINYYDSYGVPPDYQFELLSKNKRKELNQPNDYLNYLLRNSKCIFNNITYQKPNTQTCGEHSSFRLNNSMLNDKQYLKFFTKNNLEPDIFVSNWCFNKLNKLNTNII
jgi:hypothetical protein